MLPVQEMKIYCFHPQSDMENPGHVQSIPTLFSFCVSSAEQYKSYTCATTKGYYFEITFYEPVIAEFSIALVQWFSLSN